jgi:hypothetical protein
MSASVLMPDGSVAPLPTMPRMVVIDDLAPIRGLRDFWHEQAAWSQATFGPDGERGPIGAVKHLALEVLHELLGIDKAKVRAFIDAEAGPDVPRDLFEFVDCQFLLFDAARRAGFTNEQYTEGCWLKLEVNKRRRWAVAKPGEPSEHIRDGEAGANG